MVTRVRSTTGCWTCRLRRKKCDEDKPICQRCKKLQLDCAGYGEKPSWMDGGVQEKLRAEQMKKRRQVQASISSLSQTNSPETAFFPTIDTNFDPNAFDFSGSNCPSSSADDTTLFGDELINGLNQMDYFGDLNLPCYESWMSSNSDTLRPESLSLHSLPISTTSIGHCTFEASAFPAPSSRPSQCSSFCQLNVSPVGVHQSVDPIGEKEGNLLLYYFEHLHGTQLPFSQKAERGWLYSVVVRTQVSYWSTVTLSAYSQGTDPSLYLVKALAALESIQKIMSNTEKHLESSLDCCFAMVQLMAFENLRGDQNKYLAYVTAAYSLLESVKNSSMSSVDMKIYNFISLAIWWLHVISGCSLRSNYVLQDPCKSSFLCGQQSLSESIPDFPMWVVSGISKISQLDQWKKKSYHNGSLSLFELVKQALEIGGQLQLGLSYLCTENKDQGSATISRGSRHPDLN